MLSARQQLIILGSAAIAWGLLAEIGFRVAGTRFDSDFYIPDRELGWALRPNAEGWQLREGRELIQINAQGFRDRRRLVRKAAGVYRIAVLGNSWTEAMQVATDKTFCGIMEQALPRYCPLQGRSVEVLNFGISGYSTAQQLLQLRSRVWDYEPDLVILAFYTARDILNNVRELNSAATPEQAPYYSISDAGIVLDTAYRDVIPSGRLKIFLQGVRYRLTQYCRTAQAVSELLRLAKVEVARREKAWKGATTGMLTLENAIYSEPSSPAIRRAWEVTEALLKEMNYDVLSHGARFWIVTLANRAQVDPDLTSRARLLTALKAPNLDYADKRIQNLGIREHIPVSSLAPSLRRIAEQQHIYLNGFPNTMPGEGHWNELGHSAAASVVIDNFCRLFSNQVESSASSGKAVTPDRYAN